MIKTLCETPIWFLKQPSGQYDIGNSSELWNTAVQAGSATVFHSANVCVSRMALGTC